MKNLIFVLFLMMGMYTSCSKDNNSSAVLIESAVGIAVKDTLGNDLLDPDNPNAFDTDNIKIFYVINGVAEEYFEGHLDAPKGYRIYKPGVLSDNEEYRIAVFLNSKESEDTPTTLIQWQNNDIDTITAEFKREPGYLVITKAFYNGEEKWEEDNSGVSVPFFEVVK